MTPAPTPTPTPAVPRAPSAIIPVLLLAAIGGLMHAVNSFMKDPEVGGSPELAFGFLLLGAYFTAKIINRLGFPKLTGYLAAGVIAGPFLLDFVHKPQVDALRIVADTATTILGLEAGSELDLKKVRPLMGVLRGITLYAIIAAMFTIAGVLFLVHPWLDLFDGMTLEQVIVVCAVIGVSLSAQSPAVAIAMLGETKADGPLSRLLLASVVVADLTVLVMFSIALAITGAVIGGAVDIQATALEVGWELFGSVLFGVALGMLIGVFLRTVKEGASMFALMVCVVVAEIGPKIGLDPLIVMLAAGIWLRNFSRADAKDLLATFESAQLPVFLVFFALAGLHLQLGELVGELPFVAAIVATRALTFFLGARHAAKRAKAEPLLVKWGWVGLVPQAGLALALANVLSRTFSSEVYGQGTIAAFGDKAATILLGVVAMNEMIAPPILRLVLVKSGEVGKRESVDFAAGGH